MSKIFENVVILSDLDGTFIDDNAKMVPANLEKIEYFKQNGGHFTFATGRATKMFSFAVPNAAEICNLPTIMCNGAYLYDFQKQEKFEEIVLDKAKVVPLLEKIHELFPTIGYRIVSGDHNLCPYMTSYIVKEKETYTTTPYLHTPLSEAVKENWSKIVFVGENAILKQISEFTDKNPIEGLLFCFSADILFEVLSVNATKAAKLPSLKRLIGNDKAKIFAIGDEGNDRLMLENADYCACPSNANEAIKKIPGIIKVCSNNEGAIKGLIEDIENNINIYNI